MTRRMLRDALVGVVYIVIILALILVSIAAYNHDFTSYTTVSLHVDNVGSSLEQGSDVKVRGVEVGTVDAITSDGKGAKISMQLTPALADKLPDNMTAQLLPKTLFGERYVNLVYPEHRSSEHLHSGDRIEPDRSAKSVELEKLFSDLLPVLRAVQPAKLNATLGEIALALHNRGTALGQSLSVVGRYLQKLAPHVPRITDDLAALGTTANTYADAVPDLVSGIDSLAYTSRVFLKQRGDYANLLTSLTAASDTTTDFVGQNQSQIIGLARDSLPSLQIAAQYSGEFPCLSRALADYVSTANAAFGAGTNHPGAHVILHVVPRGASYSPEQIRSEQGGVCPYNPAPALSGTALSAVPGATGAHSATPDGTSASVGMGPANSPQENAVIAQLVAPGHSGTYPRWSSLLLGPALRGAKVSSR